MRINYYISSLIHLSLEDYYNAGLDPEKVRNIIENIYESYDLNSFRLICHPQGINSNWNVGVFTTNEDIINEIVKSIEFNLNMELENLKK